MNGIDRVEFSVDGGPWASVTEMTLNPRTGVVEYWATLDAELLPAEADLEVRAVVYPKSGTPRVLGGEWDETNAYQGTQWTGEHSLELFANYEPQIVEVQAGNYTWGMPPFTGSNSDDRRWLTFRPAPGVGQGQIVLNERVRKQPAEKGIPKLNFKKVHFQGITLRTPDDNGVLSYSSKTDFWFDNVHYQGRGQRENGYAEGTRYNWWTDSKTTDHRFGQMKHFVRNCELMRIGEKGIRFHYFVVNVKIDDVNAAERHDPSLGGWHASAISNPMYHDNRIYYGIEMTNVPMAFSFREGTWEHKEHTDVALVNCTAQSYSDQAIYLGGTNSNMYWKDCSFIGNFALRTGTSGQVAGNLEKLFVPELVVLENVVWNNTPTWYESEYWRESGIEFRSSIGDPEGN